MLLTVDSAHHGDGFHAIHHSLEVLHHLPGVVVGDGGGVARANAVTPVDQHGGKDRAVPLGLNAKIVLGEEVEAMVIV